MVYPSDEYGPGFKEPKFEKSEQAADAYGIPRPKKDLSEGIPQYLPGKFDKPWAAEKAVPSDMLRRATRHLSYSYVATNPAGSFKIVSTIYETDTRGNEQSSPGQDIVDSHGLPLVVRGNGLAGQIVHALNSAYGAGLAHRRG
jgi:hypothetical protein